MKTHHGHLSTTPAQTGLPDGVPNPVRPERFAGKTKPSSPSSPASPSSA